MRCTVYPERGHGMTLSPGLWIMKCIVAEWLVSHVAFVFHGPGRVPSLIPFFLDL